MSDAPDLTRREPATDEDQLSAVDAAVRTPENGNATFDRLVAAGRLRPARRDLRSLGVPSEAPHDIPISQALDELRS